jgi:tetratricopeptide (TPR) repeat protein
MTPLPESATLGAGATAGAGGTAQPLRRGPLEAGAPFGVRYRILRELGAGGMGVVYQAWDDELGVAVALKVIRPEVTADPYIARDVERRFKRELLLARQVTHKNVVRIHDLGEVDGIKYITMPFIEGRDLASVLKEEGALPVPRAVRLARQIAAGLQAANEAGVVHRDLKPENVMVDADDTPRIMDFGISRSVESGGSTMTAQGAVVGTLEYMAPEQGRGQQVDHRADIYAFGLIVYDMLAGRHRLEKADSAIAELMGRMQTPPAALRTLVPQVPEGLEQVVGRCLDPDPEKRFATTAALVEALEALDPEGRARQPVAVPSPRPAYFWPAIAAAALIAALAIGTAVWWRGAGGGAAPPAAREPVSVLIADFQNNTGDPLFQGSLEQALGIAIEGAGFISTYPRADALATLTKVNPGQTLDENGAKIVATRDGIPVILAGSISPDGGGYRVALKAVQPRPDRDQIIVDENVRVSGKGDVLKAIGTLAAAIRSGLGDTAEIKADAPETFTAASIDAMRAYVRGQELNAAGKSLDALKEFENAVMHDPQFGRAYVNMASIYTNLKMDAEARQYYELAMKNTDRMTDREKYRTRGIYYLGVARDYEQAISNFQRLVDEYPADNVGYANLALAYLYIRDIKKAVEVGRKATEVYPKSVIQRTNYGTYSMYAGDFPTAVTQTGMVLKDNPKYEYAHLTRALSLLADGKTDDARAAYAALGGLGPLGRSMASMGEADLEMYFGRYRRAVEVLTAGMAADEQEKSTTHLAWKLVALAEAHLAMGQPQPAGAAASRALSLSEHESVRYPAARVLIAVGQADRARPVAAAMEQALQRPTRSYGRLLSAALLLERKQYNQAIDAIREALKLHDSWAGHVLHAEALAAAGVHNAATDEFELCLTRRGEATDVFFADSSTLRYLAPIHYWLGRSKQANPIPSSPRENYERFLELRQQADPPDPLAIDARQRLAALPR